MDNAQLDELIDHCLMHPLSDALLCPLLGELGRAAFCDAFSRRVAHRYAASRLDFEAADAAMNRLFAFSHSGEDDIFSGYAWSVFRAFDEGEYTHAGDPGGTDPEAKYTRAQIAAIVARDLVE